MPTPAKGPRLGGSPAHERHMLANLATALFEHRSITTTEHRAKRLRPVVERLITLAKRGDLHARRKVMRTVKDKGIVHELFTEIAPTMAERHGGYTRITKTAPRKGDNAPMAVIELILEPVSPKQATVREAEKAAERAAAPAASDSPESPESADSPESPESADSPESAESAESADSAKGVVGETIVEQAKAEEAGETQQAAAETSAQAATEAAKDAGAPGTDTGHGKQG
ncbi:MAG TPA: 50S ribosomal protein L17 [Actinomycetaceae bacterium]|nr:50S ribosomal protein L17 [Actinomycetaceae bacterium]